MIIAIATDEGYVSPHFGRCQAYTMVDIVNGNVLKKELVANPGHEPGAIPEFLNDRGANKSFAEAWVQERWDYSISMA